MANHIGESCASVHHKAMMIACAIAILTAHTVRAEFGVPITPATPLNSTAASDTGGDSSPFVLFSNGIWLCVWHSSQAIGGIGTDNDIFISRSLDGGTTWSPVGILNSTALEDGIFTDEFPRLATNGNGTWLCAWMSNNTLNGTLGPDREIFFARSVDDGLTWSEAGPLNLSATTDLGNDFDVTIATDANGVWVAVWRSLSNYFNNGTDGDLFFARSVDEGQTWTFPAILNSTALSDTSLDMVPDLACDQQGNWIVVWQSNNPLGGTIGTDHDIVFSRSVDGGITWSPVAPLNANAASDTGLDHDPRIATNGAGLWIAVWASTDTLNNTIGSDEDILWARSLDNGQTWSMPVAVHAALAADSASDLLPRVQCGYDNRWVIAWHSDNTMNATIGSDHDILASNSSDGGLTWTAPAPLNSTAATDSGLDEEIVIACDDVGGWIAAWESRETMGGTLGLDLDIFTARFALPDCNANTIADATEPDANQNGIPDDCDNPNACPADITGDNAVNVSDLLAIISGWGPCPAPPQPCSADVNADGAVNVTDLLAVIAAWGPCP